MQVNSNSGIPNPVSDFCFRARSEPKLLKELEQCESGDQIANVAKREGFSLPCVTKSQITGAEDFDLTPCCEKIAIYHTVYYGPLLKELNDLFIKKQKTDGQAGHKNSIFPLRFFSRIQIQKKIRELKGPASDVNGRAFADILRAHQTRLMLGLPHNMWMPLQRFNATNYWKPISQESKKFQKQGWNLHEQIQRLPDSDIIELVGDETSHLLLRHRVAIYRLLQVISIIEWEQYHEEHKCVELIDKSIPPPRWIKQALSRFRTEYEPYEKYDDLSPLNHSALAKRLPARCTPTG